MNTIAKTRDAALERTSKKIPIPDGFTTMWRESGYSGQAFVLTNNTDIELIFEPGGCGTTKYKIDERWHTFDRRGVESSFYWVSLFKKDKVDFKVVIDEQLRRIAEKREYYKTAIAIPDVGYTTSPDGLEQLKKRLSTKGFVTFTPSGFGTGYTLRKTQPRHPYGVRRAKPELEKLFGISPLWLESFDAD